MSKLVSLYRDEENSYGLYPVDGPRIDERIEKIISISAKPPTPIHIISAPGLGLYEMNVATWALVGVAPLSDKF